MADCGYLAGEILEYLGRAYRHMDKAHALIELTPNVSRVIQAAEQAVFFANHRYSQAFNSLCNYPADIAYFIESAYETVQTAQNRLSGNTDQDHELLSNTLNDFESDHTRVSRALLSYLGTCQCK